MTFELSHTVKNRVTGLIVLLAIAAIFLPGLMKQSNKRFADSLRVSMKLPNKPITPRLDIPNEKTLLKSVKVVHLTLPKLAEPKPISTLVKAEPLSIMPPVEAPVISQLRPIEMPESKLVVVAENKPVGAVKKKVVLPKPKQLRYAVQLASFSKQVNAKSLVSTLQKKGYPASYNKFSSQHGDMYKVMVGQLNKRDEAIYLQKKLANNLQLKGMIIQVNTEVG